VCRLPPPVPGRMAPDRYHGAPAVGSRSPAAGHAGAGGEGEVRAAVSLEVLDAGPLTTVQDLGRVGWAHLGVPRAGALDRAAARLANRLVGNPEGAAVLETTLGGVTVRALRSLTFAVTGADAAVWVGRRAVSHGLAVTVPAGAVVSVGPARQG